MRREERTFLEEIKGPGGSATISKMKDESRSYGKPYFVQYLDYSTGRRGSENVATLEEARATARRITDVKLPFRWV